MDAFDFSSAPAEYLAKKRIFDMLVILTGMSWVINYILTARKIFRDRACGMPLVCLCCNIAWEMMVVLIHRPPYFLMDVFFALWLSINMVILYGSVKFSMKAQLPSPLMHKHLPLIIVLTIMGFLSGYLVLAQMFDPTKGVWWGGMFSLLLMSASCLGQLVHRGSTHGASWAMWISRVIGSYSAVTGVFLKAWIWPQMWGWSDNALTRWFVGTSLLVDVIYGFIFWYIRQTEKGAEVKKAVIIVGGSIAGLTLAHCFSKAGIDYIVLEKRKQIAPQEGASIGILPHGGQILQQLGLFYLIEEQIEPLHTAHQCFPDGFAHTTKAPRVIHERFGLPLAFLERRRMLRVLYDTLPDASRILVGKAVISVEREDSDLMRVTTQDGNIYHGSLVVGADGVHSRVRAEMWRLANSKSPGAFPEHEMSSMTVEFACVFGISSSVPKLKAGEQVGSLNNGRSYLIFPGKNGRVFWFLLLKLDRKYSYSNAPRFSSTDAEKMCERYADDHIWDGVCFRDLWRNRQVFSMTNLEENVFQKWHWERIVCIGDSMHKMAPNTGQGANCAIEDAAALVNCLYRALRATPGGTTLSPAEIDGLLEKFNRTRLRRVLEIYQTARMVVRLHSRQNLFLKVLGRYYLPYSGDFPADTASKAIAGAEHLDFLPLPARSGTGWHRFKPGQRGTALIACLYSALALALCVLAWIGNDFVRNRFVFA
ncbi:FAD-dependent monooxygenase spyC [Aspergillus thermomutatus]|uniref:FAD-binding domain-containing protein n=1 Tax=Aspergillus thermomutatus TaxID=41047 RepID=A0A397GV08_ASPTH|nr:uncharacterized protein CDV56_105272 [Aspergillus thermomutatus]RHZ54852.1 hypothetical protein CDV56_105272 [Aspergillus thermomutatus]